MMVTPKVICGPSQEMSFTVITWNPESNCTCRLKDRYQNYRHDFRCDVGERELSDAWTGFTRFIFLSDMPPVRYTWSEERLTRKQTTSRPDKLWPEMWKQMYDAAKKKAKQSWAIEKPELDNARQLRGVFFIEPNDEEFKLTMKAARTKLEVPMMPAAMSCKIHIKSSVETHRNIGKRKTTHACVVDADETTRPRLEGAVHKLHQDHITAKGMNSTTHYSLVHQFIPIPQAL